MKYSIRFRIALQLSLALAIIVAVYAVSLLSVARQRLISELDAKLVIEAMVTADLIRLAPAEPNRTLELRDIVEVEELDSPEDAFDLEVWEGDEIVYRRSPAKFRESLSNLKFDSHIHDIAWQEMSGHRIRMFQHRFQHSGATWYVRVAADEQDALQTMGILRPATLAGIPLVLALAWLLSYWLAGRALKPLTSMAAEAGGISTSNLKERIEIPNTGDEVAQLALEFNELLGRLHVAFTDLRQFTADASHELRTPLTVMRSVGEVALLVDKSPQQYRDTISQMLEEVDRLTRLVEALLTLARGGTEGSATTLTEVVPREMVDAVCEQLRSLAKDRDQALAVHGPVTPPESLDANLVELATMNLVHNALKFTPQGGRIDVHVHRGRSALTIAVEDSGPGIAVSERDKVFARFYRSDQQPAQAERGFGLGLSIARAAIVKLGGNISAGESATGGARMEISIPLVDRFVL